MTCPLFLHFPMIFLHFPTGFFPIFPHIFRRSPWCHRPQDPEISPVEVYLDGLGGGGWQRRPAEPGSLWRVENAVEVPEGWTTGEEGAKHANNMYIYI